MKIWRQIVKTITLYLLHIIICNIIICQATHFLRVHHFPTCSLGFHWLLPATLDHTLDESINSIWILHFPQGLPIVDSQQIFVSGMALSLLLYFGIHEIYCAIEQQPLKKGRPFYYFMGNLTLGVGGQTDVCGRPSWVFRPRSGVLSHRNSCLKFKEWMDSKRTFQPVFIPFIGWLGNSFQWNSGHEYSERFEVFLMSWSSNLQARAVPKAFFW